MRGTDGGGDVAEWPTWEEIVAVVVGFLGS